jgi:hypothetical protein
MPENIDASGTADLRPDLTQLPIGSIIAFRGPEPPFLIRYLLLTVHKSRRV